MNPHSLIILSGFLVLLHFEAGALLEPSVFSFNLISVPGLLALLKLEADLD
jgi:hypothetical protein